MMAPIRDANVVKLAVEMRTSENKPIPYLGEFSLQQPLAAFVVELCTHWKVENPEYYALQYTEPTCHYVTEKNRGRIKDGTVLHMVYSASRTADDILQKLKKEKQILTIYHLPLHRKTSINKHQIPIKQTNIFQGISLLISCMEMQKNDSILLPNILISFLELMDHGIMPWDDLQPTFIEKVASYINVQGTLDPRTLSTSLAILENIVTNSQNKYATVEKQITMPKLLQHISNNKKVEIQQSVLALINSLIQKSDAQKRRYYSTTLFSRQYRTILTNNGGNVGADMAHQLYVLQQLLLNQYEERMSTSMDASDQDATDKIKELRRIAFETDGECSKDVTTRRPEYKKEYKKLGFRNDINPAQDFMDTPPGIYAKLVLENCYRADSHECPKVLSVVKDQIWRTMIVQPSTLENFRSKINTLTYAEIAEIWQQERINNEEQEMQAPPIKELRTQLEPEILELIQQHRLRFLVEGTRFKSVRGARTKDKFRYCRLSPNHKFFHYDECDEKSEPTIDELGKKISIVDIKSIVTGKECPHMKDKAGKKNAYNLAFSLILESNNVNETNSVDFVAPDDSVFSYWVDGVNALLRQRMPSAATSRDLEMLLNMEIKLRLLDAEGVTIPQQQPVVPPPPPNYNFCYQLP
ncbi:Engulfment and cell motility protein 2-like [Homarus americanus]|uniref:Engulfment and cell motility protein 2-like n=1 Tax=Homarus americanus TaxID=6706 RepID=A0A8J5MJG7_HOMAM|nr:Engulfment and cell motility protein 2-like [Homarus americanus]